MQVCGYLYIGQRSMLVRCLPLPLFWQFLTEPRARLASQGAQAASPSPTALGLQAGATMHSFAWGIICVSGTFTHWVNPQFFLCVLNTLKLCLSFIFKFITSAVIAEKVSLKSTAQAKMSWSGMDLHFCLPIVQINMARFLYLRVFGCFDIGIKPQRYLEYAEQVLCNQLHP